VKKQPGSNYFKFTDKESDLDPAVPYNAVVEELQKPTENNRQQFQFKNVTSKVMN